ncbi:MAG: hypothetical protein IT462_11275, partial [Planctomycetes bacterium]|nr:hypothetical protein [Planctomycetota bacterium]
VPCGGVVSASSNGKETIWLSAWGRDGKEGGRIEKTRENTVAPEITAKPVDDPHQRWRAKGNFWVVKTTSTKPAAKETYTRTEVVDFKDDEASYMILTFDKDMKETARRDGLKISLRGDAGAPEAAGQAQEDVECKALGRVKAARSDIAGAGLKSTMWTWKGIVVRSIAQGAEIDSQSELWETNLK